MVFAEIIKQTRQKLFMSQEAFAQQLNVTLSTVNRWETGRSKPNFSTMKRIKEFCETQNIEYKSIEESWLSS